MKEILKSVSLAASVALATGIAGQASATIQKAANGQGDLLFIPVALMTGSWVTDMSLVNNSNPSYDLTRGDNFTTVSKVVVRTQKESAECLDFLVYLTPGDRMVGRFMEASLLPAEIAIPTKLDGTDAEYVFYSTDDSVRSLVTGNPASATDPAVYPIQDAPNSNDSCAISYVETIQAYATTEFGPAVVSKSSVIAAYDVLASTPTSATAPNPKINPGAFGGIHANKNVMSGDYTLSNALNGVKMSTGMDTFANYDTSAYLNVIVNTKLCDTTYYGANCMTQLESAMAQQDVSIPYEHDTTGESTIATFTFPTKMVTDTGVLATTYNPLRAVGVGIRSTVRDLQERVLHGGCTYGSSIVSPPPADCQTGGETPLEFEVNLVQVSQKIAELASVNANQAATFAGSVIDAQLLADNFQKGWLNVFLVEDTSDAFLGAPVLTTVMQFSVNPQGGLNGSMINASHSVGDASVNEAGEPGH